MQQNRETYRTMFRGFATQFKTRTYEQQKEGRKTIKANTYFFIVDREVQEAKTNHRGMKI